MRKHEIPCDIDTMRPEYDFSGGVRGKYAGRLAKGTDIVRLDPDVAEVFPTGEAVNDALRLLAETARKSMAARGRKKTAA